ncbi:MAG: hypothetical protein QOI36_1945 [Pseudonocardiales bacterium]|jgi:hypothetical protein|nr:hypothetical protein [Pseudonocardiales bacterium]
MIFDSDWLIFAPVVGVGAQVGLPGSLRFRRWLGGQVGTGFVGRQPVRCRGR